MQELIIDTWRVSKLSTILRCLYFYKFIGGRGKEKEDARIFPMIVQRKARTRKANNKVRDRVSRFHLANRPVY